MSKRRRSYRGTVGIQLGDFNPFKGDVAGADVIMGAVLGLAGTAALEYGVSMIPSTSLVDSTGAATTLGTIVSYVPTYGPLLGGALGGALGFIVGNKMQKNLKKGHGYMTGALAAGAGVTGWKVMVQQLGSKLNLSDTVGVRLGNALETQYLGRYRGVHVTDRSGFNGVHVDDMQPRFPPTNFNGVHVTDDPIASDMAMAAASDDGILPESIGEDEYWERNA